MAKKKENQLSYLQMPLPQGRKYQKMTKRSWCGLNYRQTIDTGALSKESNISTLEAPYLTPSQRIEMFKGGYIGINTVPIGIFGFDDSLVIIYRDKESIRVDYVIYNADTGAETTHRGVIKLDGATAADDKIQRCAVQFNVYDTPTDPVTGKYIKKILIFPDKVSMYTRVIKSDTYPTYWEHDVLYAADPTALYYCTRDGKSTYYYIKVTKEEDEKGNVTYSREAKQSGGDNYFMCNSMDTEVLIKEYTPANKDDPPGESASHNYYYRNSKSNEVYRWVDDPSDNKKSAWKVSTPPSYPNIKYATVHMSRLFGVDDERVYASGYNDYTNWNLDTVAEYNESNAWCSPAQSNTKAGGKFTGITNFQGHVVCFKRDYMHEIYNNKNPFRIQDIYAEGAIDNRTIQDVDGRLIFVSDDAVKIYTGSNPRIISYELNMLQFKNAVSGTDGRCYYLYCEDADDQRRLFVYDTLTEYWSERNIDVGVLGFAHNKNGTYFLSSTGTIYHLESGDYMLPWHFETDLITNETVNIKHLKKIQMLVDIPAYAGVGKEYRENIAGDGQQAWVRVYVLYDDEEFNAQSSHLVYTSTGYGRKAIRVKPRNRKNAGYGIKLHIEGSGYAKLYEAELFIEAGGDLYA